MAEKLTVVVTCTDRKSLTPAERLRVENLPDGHQSQRVEQWRTALRQETARVSLRRLYQGDAWKQAFELERTLRDVGFEPSVLVASAGLGLVPVDEEWPAYAATFSSRHADTVGRNAADIRAWWKLITQEQKGLVEHAEGQTLMVLSETYSSAMAEDLAALKGRDDVVIFGGSKDVPGELRIPADAALRGKLGGTSGSLNVRTANAWIARLDSPNLVGQRNNGRWRAWVDEVRRPEVYERKPMTDDDVLAFIREVRLREPTMRKTAALRILRDNGLACEQRRFGGLFSAVEKEDK
ncbi:aryl carrier-like protein [Pseudarthrobacter defluvii]|uniref:hypothetical protein n=1 Tax=Pseudarthrobacter defluvii TaxID=410837 RepID=UPI0027825449|nr:hypothetical protein [Pseudarthrobacter defluvii]MDQ0770257.1 aryl carrier-like protein [Pseudarthrobacter defluvii]